MKTEKRVFEFGLSRQGLLQSCESVCGDSDFIMLELNDILSRHDSCSLFDL